MVKRILSKVKCIKSGAAKGHACTLKLEESFLITPDNQKIATNHYIAGHNEVVILAHGWFMTKDSRSFDHMAKILSNDFDVISFDFRGHGKSSGLYTFGLKECIDIKTVMDFAKEKNYKKIYLMGFSLGAAISVIHCAEHNDVDKMIVVSAPHSFKKIENQMWRKEAFLPTLIKFEFKRWFSVRPHLPSIRREKINPIDVVQTVNVPTLFIAGGKDPTVHVWHTECLHDKAECEKKFELFKTSFHAEDLFLQEEERFIKSCKEWLKD